MAAEQIPSWEDDDSFNSVGLGEDYLPGTWTIEGLECGIDCDTKKAKGADGPTSTDNGVKADPFSLVGLLTARDWPAFQAIIPKINPRRPGRERQPVEILHQDTELLGIRHVRILSLKFDPPTARDGRKVTIKCIEWFDKPKETKSKKNPKDERIVRGPPAPAQQVLVSADSFIEVPVFERNESRFTGNYDENDQPIYETVPVYRTERRPDPNGPQRTSVLDFVDRRRELDQPLPDTTSQEAIMGNLLNAGNPGGLPPP